MAQLDKLVPASRKVKVLVTLGPTSRRPEMISELMEAGADAFRVNMSHGDHEAQAALMAAIRAAERELGRPVAILCDLQGPKLRVGCFQDGQAVIGCGDWFTFDQDPAPGDATRVYLPHPELFSILQKDQRLLIDDGKLRLRVIRAEEKAIFCSVEIGGVISDRKGMNAPDTVVPIPALNQKDRRDLTFAVEHCADWIALSFVQRPEDVAEAKQLIRDAGGIDVALMAKIETSAAVDWLNEIIDLADGIMIARGDLGVELNPEDVPPLQKRIIEATRSSGKPVVVATQMLESMIESPTPTRAEVSDVANAVYDGADAVMLSAETASGAWHIEAVTMMHRITTRVETDPALKAHPRFSEPLNHRTTADALARACAQIAQTMTVTGIIVFTGSGSTAQRVARERPSVRLLVLTPSLRTARRLTLLWGTYPVHTGEISSFGEMIAKGKCMAVRHGFGTAGSKLLAVAGAPFGTPGSINLLHVVSITGDDESCGSDEHRDELGKAFPSAAAGEPHLCYDDCENDANRFRPHRSVRAL